MCRGLVGDDVDRRVVGEQPRHDRRGVAEKTDRQRSSGVTRSDRHPQRLVNAVGAFVQIAVLEPAGDPRCVDLDAQHHPAIHRHRQRLCAAHPAEPGGERDRSGQRAAEALGRDCGERLVGALENALGSDVDPRAGGHLAIHGQSGCLQPAELAPVAQSAPAASAISTRRHRGSDHADRLARWHQQGLVIAQVGEHRDDRWKASQARAAWPDPP